MKPLTASELAESAIIIPATTWESLPRSVTDLLYGYIGTPVSNGKMSGYRFVVPQYLQDQLNEAFNQWKELT